MKSLPKTGSNWILLSATVFLRARVFFKSTVYIEVLSFTLRTSQILTSLSWLVANYTSLQAFQVSLSVFEFKLNLSAILFWRTSNRQTKLSPEAVAISFYSLCCQPIDVIWFTMLKTSVNRSGSSKFQTLRLFPLTEATTFGICGWHSIYYTSMVLTVFILLPRYAILDSWSIFRD